MKERKTQRETNRLLPILYDLLIYLAAIIAFVVMHPSYGRPYPAQAVLLVSVVTAVLLFAMRLFVGVYRQIWRYGNLRAFVRLIFADAVGGTVAVIILQGINDYTAVSIPISAMRTLLVIVTTLLVTIVSRICYYYLYSFAGMDSLIGTKLRKFLRIFAMVEFDPSDSAAYRPLIPDQPTGSAQPINAVQNIARKFQIHGRIISIEPLNKGYINSTYRVKTLSEAGHYHYYTLQRINTNVFPDVDGLMENFMLVSTHLRDNFLLPGHGEKGSIQSVKSTVDGKAFFRDDSGCWRMMTHFINVYSLDIPDSPRTFYYAGQAFGAFIKKMSDVPVEKIHITIPNFHDTAKRYETLERSVLTDQLDRVKGVKDEIELIRARKENYGLIATALAQGRLPLRICHNDCNLNNILFDDQTKLPVAIIDLDTVMPSTPLYDYGDSMRIGTNTAKDDEKNLKKVSCNLELYEQYARGYLEQCGSILTEEELALLPYASLIITAEDGIRFLTDHIDGDVYYNIFYHGQNLDRARTQLALLEDMEKKLPQIYEILERVYADLKLDVKTLDKYKGLWRIADAE